MSKLDPREVTALVQARVKRVLDLAELAVPADKFERFRTLVLDEFGHKGFQGDLIGKVAEGANGADRHGMGRNDTGRKGGS
jgi:hypothetical protein